MAKSAILLGQFAIGAATSHLSMKEYGDSACSEGVKKETLMPMSSFMGMLAQGMGLQDIVLGSCVNGTQDYGGFVMQMSQKFFCNTTGSGTFLAMNVYLGSETCDETSLSPDSSQSWACQQQGSSQKWQAYECVADVSSYSVYTFDQFAAQDCPGTAANTMELLYESGRCNVDSSLEGGSWVAGSGKLTRSCDSVTIEAFDTDDCSGAATNTTLLACGGCTEMDDAYATLGCPVGPTCAQDGGNGGNGGNGGTQDGEDGGVGNADQAIQLSSGMAVLVLLGLQAL